MRVLVITGDKSFKAGHPRYELQRSVVDELSVVYWGWGSVWPALPRGPFDVVTVQDPFCRGLFGWYAARKLRAKFNVQVHTDLVAASFVRRTLAQVVLRHADSVRVVSEKIKLEIENWKIKTTPLVLPVYVDIERFKVIVRHPEQNTILWIGRFEDEKDPMVALDVLKNIHDAKLIMLGKGRLEQTLRAEISRSNLDRRVELVGWQDPAPYLARAAVVLSTSRHESFGASIVESLAAGVPVVAPDVGVSREAGAIVVGRSDLPKAVAEVLRSGMRGELRLTLPSKEEWVRQWVVSLQS